VVRERRRRMVLVRAHPRAQPPLRGERGHGWLVGSRCCCR
jgi:hypothetical protein